MLGSIEPDTEFPLVADQTPAGQFTAILAWKVALSRRREGITYLSRRHYAACGLPQAGGTNWQPYGRAVPDAALTPAALAAATPAPPRPKHHRLCKALVVLLLLALAALAAGWYYTGGDLAALPQKLQSLGAESLPHAGARLV